jgi:ketosteroid isomerase-like protein
MRLIWLAALLTLLGRSHQERDRAALLAADRAHARSSDFLSAFADDARYLHPDAPLVRGTQAIRAVLAGAHRPVTWAPEYGDVSDDGTLGYTYGWTQLGDQQGKYLACWRKQADGPWRISAYARTKLANLASTPPATPVPTTPEVLPAPPVRGRADSRELLSADSAFSALSVARGAKTAFVTFAADQAVLLGPGGTPMTHGREAIGGAFAGFPADAVLEWAPVGADIAASGDLGCTVGEAAVRARGTYSKYLTIWKRQPDGAWKFVADGGNARPGP